MKTIDRPVSTLVLGNMNMVLPENFFIETGKLTKFDRCDSCSAAAYVRAVKDDSELIFCAHHARKNLESLASQGWQIDDQTTSSGTKLEESHMK